MFDIFLDMDGVITNFRQHTENTDKPLIDGKRDWESMGRDWWASMPAINGAKEFYKELQQLGTVFFLSGTILNPGCHSGKCDWIVNFTESSNSINSIILCSMQNKRFLAAKHRILIDDNTKNINSWICEGGIAILHESHSRDFSKTLSQVRGNFNQ